MDMGKEIKMEENNKTGVWLQNALGHQKKWENDYERLSNIGYIADNLYSRRWIRARAEAPVVNWDTEMNLTAKYKTIAESMEEKEKEKEMNTDKLKNKIKKVVYVDKDIKVKEQELDSDGNPIEKDGKPVTKDKLYKGMVKVFWKDGKETVAYTSLSDRFNKEEGFKTCVMKYVFGNRDSYDAVDC